MSLSGPLNLLRKVVFSLRGFWWGKVRKKGFVTSKLSYDEYLRLQLAKTQDPIRRQKWLSEEWEPKVGAFLAAFEELFEKWGLSPSNALFVGARTGQEVEAARRLGVEAIGIDLEPAPPLVVFGDMHQIPFDEGKFDFVFSNCFDHALFPGQMVSELERVTREDGIICVQVQLNTPDDAYGVTDLWDLSAVVQLFQRSKVLTARALPKSILAMNAEVVMKKVSESKEY